MVADGDFIELQLIRRMYDYVCEYHKNKMGGRPFLVMFKEFELLCGFENINDVYFRILKRFVILRKVACYQCEARVCGKLIATAYFGLGESNG